MQLWSMRPRSCLRINWRRITWCAVVFWIAYTGPYWWERYQESQHKCNPHVIASCEP